MLQPQDPTCHLPHSLEAEEAVVGSVLINEFLFDELADLEPADFYIHRLRFVWQAYLRLHERKQPIDGLTVSVELEDMGRLEEIGGPAYLTSLFNQVPTTLHAEAYAEIIKACSLRRKLLGAANRIATLAYDTSIQAQEAVESAFTAVREAAVTGQSADDDGSSFAEIASLLFDEAVARARSGETQSARRIATEWEEVNTLLAGGFGAGKLYVVAGRPGEGKSSWLGNIAYHAASTGKRTGIYSLEMEQREVMARVLAGLSGVKANIIADGNPASEDWEPLVRALEQVNEAQGHIFYTPNLTPSGLRAKAHRLKQKHGLDLLVVDYLQLMRGDGRSPNREQEVSSLSRELKILAGELGIPVVVAAQLNRAVEQRAEKEPQLSDLRESGAIENDADAVIFLWRPEKSGNVTNLKVAKHRGGATGSVELYFDMALTRFRNLAKREAE